RRPRRPPSSSPGSAAGRPNDELFALRALAHRPLHELRHVHPAPGHAYHEGDRDVVRRLAALELAALGLAPAPAAEAPREGAGR
ncbi:MAG: hypothetical protein M3P96_13200, partial [Actinomycetota bacterium]|nr:hypothetical protein [Actinomycetota bacterium]